MSKKLSYSDIHSLPESEIITGFRLCHQNARDLLRAAEYLHLQKLTPQANSLIILAVEEEIKGQVIHGAILNRQFASTLDFKLMFRAHEVKKEVAKRTLWIWENFGREVKKIGIQKIKENPEIFSTLMSAEAPIPSTKNDRAISGWFNDMPTMREKGLYIDFSGGKWVSPTRVKKEHYKNSLELCKMLMAVGDHIESTLVGK